MSEPAPAKATREGIAAAVGWSILIPGLAHFLADRKKEALAWFLGCQMLLIIGLVLAGNTQFDYGRPFGVGGSTLVWLQIPEGANFLATQVLARVYPSVELGGRVPTELPWRNLGYILSAASGVLAMFCAAHAAGVALITREPLPPGAKRPRLHPGEAALATLVFPGFGHWLIGRRFKAVALLIAVFGLFLLGAMLGEFGDLDRQRHPYYWVGQMLLGLPAWLISLFAGGVRYDGVPTYIDAGLLFTTTAGFFNVIAALDAFHRAETDWHRARGEVKE
jgi:hypothetical protein